MIKTLITFLLMALSVAAFAVHGADGEQQLEAFLQGLTSLRADFEQTIELPDQQGVAQSHGTFYLKRPGRVRWEYAPPNDQLIVADGSRIWLYDKELEQVSHRSQAAALKGTPAQLLSEVAPVDRDFVLTSLGERDGLEWVELQPRDKESQFNKLLLAFSHDQLRRLDMFDQFGQKTHFFFTTMERNPTLNDKLFTFKPPSGIDLIGDL